MLISIINNLTKQQRAELDSKGISTPVMSMWRTGKRRPTYAQCVYLTDITGHELTALLKEIALSEVKRDQQKNLHKEQAID